MHTKTKSTQVGPVLAIALIAALAVAVGPAVAEGPEGPLQLITAEEAALPIDTMVANRTLPTDGPRIEISNPTNNAVYDGPFPIDVQFKPGESGAAVDMSTLRLEYKRAWGIDITSRVKDYVHGERIMVEEAELPSGSHTVEIQIQDVGGKRSAILFTVVVKG